MKKIISFGNQTTKKQLTIEVHSLISVERTEFIYQKNVISNNDNLIPTSRLFCTLIIDIFFCRRTFHDYHNF
ncbi:hypothetical protein DERP_007629 [Dermatophagoides pteronyssinus]|uniref:Uncharacterized protein n=1 Tax=Dermatophagoides pteronyssinus TaxID=6956 RepID=A0ABQ8JKA7_DERPT|nr:hypothetical protein DERP_007629 [Dermatophagoides pteronyssinus]